MAGGLFGEREKKNSKKAQSHKENRKETRARAPPFFLRSYYFQAPGKRECRIVFNLCSWRFCCLFKFSRGFAIRSLARSPIILPRSQAMKF